MKEEDELEGEGEFAGNPLPHNTHPLSAIASCGYLVFG